MKQLYEFKEASGNDAPEVLMSRLSDENNDLDRPDFTVTLAYSSQDKRYYVTSDVEDADGDDDRDEDDAYNYELATKMATELKILSSVGDKKKYQRILLRFKQGTQTDIEILHFTAGNTEISKPDAIVTATKPSTSGVYQVFDDSLDANADGKKDDEDKLIYRRIATSFAAMKDLKP